MWALAVVPPMRVRHKQQQQVVRQAQLYEPQSCPACLGLLPAEANSAAFTKRSE